MGSYIVEWENLYVIHVVVYTTYYIIDTGNFYFIQLFNRLPCLFSNCHYKNHTHFNYFSLIFYTKRQKIDKRLIYALSILYCTNDVFSENLSFKKNGKFIVWIGGTWYIPNDSRCLLQCLLQYLYPYSQCISCQAILQKLGAE